MTRRDLFTVLFAPFAQTWPNRPQTGSEPMTPQQLTEAAQRHDAYVFVCTQAWKAQRRWNVSVDARLPEPGPRPETLRET